MAKRQAVDWERVRAAFEVGGPSASFRALGEKFGVSHTAVRKRADAEGWKQDLEPAIQRATTAHVSGAVSSGNPEKQQQAIDAEAAKRAEVIKRHRAEWQQIAALRQEALALRRGADGKATRETVGAAFEAAKLAKITAELTGIQQAGERKAYRLDQAEDGGGKGSPQRVEIVWVNETLGTEDGGDDE